MTWDRVRSAQAKLVWLGEDLLAVIARGLERPLERSRERSKRQAAEVDATAVVMPEAAINNLQPRSQVVVGPRTVIRGELQTFGHGGHITIGSDCYVGAGSRLWSAVDIAVGDRVLIAHNCDIQDWNTHPLVAAERHAHFRAIMAVGHPRELRSAPGGAVVLEDDCWLGAGAAVLKGVRIGRGAVVAARSVVTKDVPALVIVAGNPARVVAEVPGSI